MIEKLILRDFKSHEYTEIPFPQGLISIGGENYAGKSSILQAIGWALFDSSPGTQTAFVRHGASKARIALELRSPLDQRLYRITRQIGSTTLWQVEDVQENEKLVDKVDHVRQWLRHHLQLTSSVGLATLFQEAVGVPQGSLVSTFLMKPVPRRKHFDAILGLSDYEASYQQLWKSGKSRVAGAGETIWRELQALEKQVARLEGETSQYDEHKSAVAQSEEAIAGLNQELQTCARLLGELELQRQGFVAQREAAEGQKLQIEQLERDFALASQSLDERSQALAQAQAAADILEAHKEGFERYTWGRKLQKESEQKLQELLPRTQELSESKEQLAVLESRLKLRQEERDEAREAQAAAEALAPEVARQDELSAKIDEIGRHQARNGQIEQRFEVLSQELAQIEAQIAESQGRIEQLEGLSEQAGTRAGLQRQEQACVEKLTERQIRLDMAAASAQHPEANFCPILQETCLNAERSGRDLRDIFAAQMDELRTQIEQLRQELEATRQALEAASDAERKCSQLPLLLEHLQHNQRQQQAIFAQIQALREEQQGLSFSPEELWQAQDALAALGTPLPKARRDQLLAIAERRARIEAEIEPLDQERQSLHHQVQELSRMLAPVPTLQATLRESKKKQERYEADYRSTLEHQQKADELEQRAREVAECKERLSGLEQALLVAREALQNAEEAFDAEAFEALKFKLRETEQKQAASQGRLDAIGSALSRQQELLDNIEEKRAQLAEASSKYALWSERHEMLKMFRFKLRDIGPEMARRTRHQLESQAQQLFAELVDDPSVHLQMTDTYGLQLTYDAFTREHEALAGSEGILAALAVRLALLSLASNLQFAFFDEPTIHLDKEHRMKLAEQLCRLQSIAQLIVISHDDSFETNVDHTIFVRKVDGVSYVEVD